MQYYPDHDKQARDGRYPCKVCHQFYETHVNGHCTVIAIEANDPKIPELLAALKRSGMRETTCEGCGCPLLTRSDSNKCPPCRGDMPRNTNEDTKG